MGHLLSSVNPAASDAIQQETHSPRKRPDVGELVIYHMRPGERRQGRTRFPALVQGHGDRGTLNITVILEAAELKNETLVEEIGPGREAHVWERPSGSHLADAFRATIASLHERIGDLDAANKRLRSLVLGDFDEPKVSIIHIMQDFENRLRAIAQENAALRGTAPAEPFAPGPRRKAAAPKPKGKTKKK
jgi:hypothetical protein